MLDKDTMDWADEFPKAYRAWRDGNKVYWFTVKNLNTGKVKRVKSYGSTIDEAWENLNIDTDHEEI